MLDRGVEGEEDALVDVYMIVLRVLHITAAAFWFGASVFIALFLERAASLEGPAGGQVMGRLAKVGMPIGMMVSTVMTGLTGALLYYRNSSGFDMDWISTGPGTAFTVGGIAGLLALLEGFVVHMPLAMKGAAIRSEIEKSGGPPTADHLAAIEKIALKSRTAARTTAGLLTIAIVAMSAARYL